VEGVPVQVHGFFSQGFMFSTGNNYMTMPTTDGSFAFTDGGLNVSAQINDKLRVGAQGYSRSIGRLGAGHVTLDWAFADYHWNDHLGVRAGKVKTVFGLYTDTQDLEFLHTWALLPQSIYPLDLRGTTIAHTGGDVYGSFSPKALGTLSYTAYVGLSPNDHTDGYAVGLTDLGVNVTKLAGTIKGVDLKWNTPLSGLLLGTGYLLTPQHFDSVNASSGESVRVDLDRRLAIFSAQYMRGAWRLDAEYSRQTSVVGLSDPSGLSGPPVQFSLDQRAWYIASAYRVSKSFEFGGYYSQFSPNDNFARMYLDLPASASYLHDPALTVRFDFKTHWDVKVEAHRITGGGDPTSFRGIYPQYDPAGLKPRTNLLIVRLGFNL
jgi:hypothetical protein